MIKQRNLLHETENIGNTLAKSRREFLALQMVHRLLNMTESHNSYQIKS